MQALVHVLWLMSFSALLLLPAVLMLLRWVRPTAMPIWAVVAVLMVGGWVLANVIVHVHQAYLTRIVMSMPDLDTDDPVARRWAADGAKMVFAAVFGWLYGPVLVGAVEPDIRSHFSGPTGTRAASRCIKAASS